MMGVNIWGDLGIYDRAYREFADLLRNTLERRLPEELAKLKMAAGERLSTGENPGTAELLVEAGLVKCLGDFGSTFRCDYVYGLTEKGKDFYERIFGGKNVLD